MPGRQRRRETLPCALRRLTPSGRIKRNCTRRSREGTKRHAQSIEFTPVQKSHIFTLHMVPYTTQTFSVVKWFRR
jgi:hypothetical protein